MVSRREKDLIQQYEAGEITLENLYRQQDEILAQQVFTGCVGALLGALIIAGFIFLR